MEPDKKYYRQKIALWVERMEKELQYTTSYMIPETTKIMREMREEVERNEDS